jgi:hypothetical protein
MAKSCCSQVQQPERPLPTAITFTGSAKTFSDRVATVYGSALGAAGATPYRREKWRRYRP